MNYLEFPSALTGVEARIIALVGKWFPTGSHKVGATFGCLVPKLVTGQFDPTTQRAVWPSTGNFCRGGAYNATVLGCDSVAVLPEGMSRERFDWLSSVAGRSSQPPAVRATSRKSSTSAGCCCGLGPTLSSSISLMSTAITLALPGDGAGHGGGGGRRDGERGRLAGFVSQSGSAGTLGAGDYLKERFPGAKIVASEALQCPTLLMNGYGAHRIEGIGDKHVPWIHNVRNTDVVTAIDDEACLSLFRLFNEPEGRGYLRSQGVPEECLEKLELLGISGIGNLLSAIKFAKYFELGSSDIVYGSDRLVGDVWDEVEEMRESGDRTRH